MESFLVFIQIIKNSLLNLLLIKVNCYVQKINSKVYTGL